jgi:hypothetical protein
MDNYFNPPDLAHFLKTKGTICVGTLCVNGKNVPSLVKEKNKDQEPVEQPMWQSLLGRTKKRVKHLFQPTIMVR